MPDETNAASGLEPTSGASQGQVPQANNSGSTSAATPQGQAPEGHTNATPLTQADYERMLAEVRKEAASQRVKLKAFEDAQAAAELAKLSDADKAAKRADAAEAALQAARTRIGASELKLASQAAGIIDPDVAVALLGGKVAYDDAGEPSNVADLVKQLKADKPHLFGAGASAGQPGQQPRPAQATAGGATNPGRQAGNGGLTLDMIRAMSSREKVARISEINAWEKANQQP